MRKTVWALLVLLTASASMTHAEPKPDAAIRYRQSIFRALSWNFGPLVDMVKGKTPFAASEFARRSERMNFFAQQLLEGFPKGSDSGAETDAKAIIWENFDDFSAKVQTLADESKALHEIAAGGDEAKTRAQFQKVAGACKSCHDKYRAD
jgi:cytochrome c556